MTIQRTNESGKAAAVAAAHLVGPENCEAVTGRKWVFWLRLVRRRPQVRRITSGRRIVAIVAEDLVLELARASDDASQVTLAGGDDDDAHDEAEGMPTSADAILARLGHRRVGA